MLIEYRHSRGLFIGNLCSTIGSCESLLHILSDNDLKSNTIHPNDQDYRLMAENIYELLVEAGAL
jgi:lysophospholipase L1-like esterase